MPDIILPGPAGRIEARYQRQKAPNAPMALILHTHPQYGGTMNNPLVYELYHRFHKLGCTTVRFNFRGVGRSQGSFDNGAGELSDAAAVLDWMSTLYPNPSFCWVIGISFGAWIGMQLLMRRPETDGFISVSPPTNVYDFSFLAPCPASGLILHGSADMVATPNEVERVVAKLRTQKGISIAYELIEGANHYWTDHLPAVEQHVGAYLDKRLAADKA